jgi:hypothetical protein
MTADRIRAMAAEAAARHLSSAKAFHMAEDDYAADMVKIRAQCPHERVEPVVGEYTLYYVCHDCGLDDAEMFGVAAQPA